ncbi:MAG: pitrilysin family protein, partial [Halobacteriales archaeon]|nr:pitrilysin family protein [Halobacteriales archaeon]
LESNGLTVLTLHQGVAPISTFMVTYCVGSRHERLGETGATHFLEHMMFKGTERFNRRTGRTVFSELQQLGARVNATTWNDRTNYYELLPSEHLAIAMEIESDRMRGALLREEDVESERVVILNEFDRSENEPLRTLFRQVWSASYEAHPYHHPTIGWRSDIENITPEGLRSFYDRYYWPDNAVVSIIGGFEEEEALGMVRKYFENIPSAPHGIPEPHTVEPEQRGERSVTVRMSGDPPYMLVAFRSPSALDDDAPALDLLGMILGSGKTSRLYGRLVDGGQAVTANASNSSFRDPGLFFAWVSLTDRTSHAEVEEAVVGEIERIATGGVTDRELRRARKKLEAHTLYSRDGSFSLAAQLNEAIAAGDWKLYTTYLERADKVTKADIRRVAGTYLTRDRMTTGRHIPTG